MDLKVFWIRIVITRNLAHGYFRLLAVMCGWARIWGIDQSHQQIARMHPFVIESISIAPKPDSLRGLKSRIANRYPKVTHRK